MDAAFNYEYAIRTREMIARSRPGDGETPRTRRRSRRRVGRRICRPVRRCTGTPGGPPPATDMNQFKIVIPKRGEERKDAPDAGKGGQKIRKG